MKRVMVDLVFFSGTKGGMESYVRNLYAAMPGDQFEFVGLASRELVALDHSWFPGQLVDSGISGESRFDWARGEVISVQRAATRLAAQLIHSPANIGPWQSSVPVVLTVHDLLPFRFPNLLPGRYAPVLRTLVRRAATNAARVLTISEQTRVDLERFVGLDSDRIDVVPLAGSTEPAPSDIPRETGLLLALGNRLPHKNFARLLDALALIPADSRPNLVITGGSSLDPLAEQIKRLGLTGSVTLEGWLPAAEIERLYARATAVIVPTLFEGFGLPVLEAMSRGCPVICSAIPVLEEVAATAAVFFNPFDLHSIADSIVATIGNQHELSRLATAGRERAAGFSWQKTALLTEGSFQLALER